MGRDRILTYASGVLQYSGDLYLLHWSIFSLPSGSLNLVILFKVCIYKGRQLLERQTLDASNPLHGMGDKADKYFRAILLVKSMSGVTAASIVFGSALTTSNTLQSLNGTALPFDFNVAMIEKMVLVSVGYIIMSIQISAHRCPPERHYFPPDVLGMSDRSLLSRRNLWDILRLSSGNRLHTHHTFAGRHWISESICSPWLFRSLRSSFSSIRCKFYDQ